MKKTVEQLVKEVAAKYRPNCPQWTDDVQDALTELRTCNHDFTNYELGEFILDEVRESFIAWKIPATEYDAYVNEILSVIPKPDLVPID